MNWWITIALVGCTNKAPTPCSPGDQRDAHGRCDSGSPSDTADIDRPEPDPSTDDTSEPTDDTGEPPPTPSWMSLSDAPIVIGGGETGARAGRAAARAGDIDGDGRGDLLIAADRAAGMGGAEWGGQVALFRGADLPSSGHVDLGRAHARWLGEAEGDLAGHTLVPGGDIDGDGTPDLLIAGYHSADDGILQGRVYGISGAGITPGIHGLDEATWTIGGSRDNETLGHGLDSAGDVDGDGRSDIVMGACCGAPAALGRVWVVTSSALTTGPIDLTTHTPRWDGESDDDQAGFKVSHLGDVDGDGLDDVAVGARRQNEGAENGGKVYVLLGTTIGTTDLGHLADADVHLVGTAIRGELGYDIGAVGDLDGDGKDEIIVGAHQGERTSVRGGEATIFLGSQLDSGSLLDTEAHIRFVTSQTNHLLGVSVESDMDLDGDGSPEVVIGASGLAPPTLDTGFAPMGMDSPGHVYLYWSHALTPGVHDVAEASVHFEGEQANDHAGIRVTSGGDVDGDGADDLLIGTERGQSGVGRAYLLTGLRSR